MPVRSARARQWLRSLLAATCVASLSTAASASAPTPAADLSAVNGRLGSMALPWVANAGQWDEKAAFRAQSFAGSVWVTRDGQLVHQFNGPTAAASDARTNGSRKGVEAARSSGWVLTERFLGGQVKKVAGVAPQSTRVNFFQAGAADSSRNLASYGSLDLGEVFPGVAVALKATNANVEKLYTVAPGRDPRVIRMQVDGAKSLAVHADGSLQALTDHGPIAFTAPIAFQEDERGDRIDIKVSYSLDAAQNQYGFSLGSYDTSRPLVIDPLLRSTYLGGSDTDRVSAVAVNPSSGLIYVAGRSRSSNFPGTSGGAQSTQSSTTGAFIARFSADLTSLQVASYFSGAAGSDTSASAIAINPNTGGVYITGGTRSTSLPGMNAQSAQSAYGGDTGDIGVLFPDAFVAQFNAALDTIVQATYHGGAGDEEAFAIAYHPTTQEIYVGGKTTGGLPSVAGGAQATSGVGRPDCFVTRFNAALTIRLQSTYISGTSGTSCQVNALAVHPINGNVYAVGTTSHPNLPGASAGWMPTISSSTQPFLTRLNAALTSIPATTYEAAGSGPTRGLSIAISPVSGAVYMGGYGGVNPSGSSAQTTGSGFISSFSETLASRLNATQVGPPTCCTTVLSMTYNAFTNDIFATGSTNGNPWLLAGSGIQPSFAGGETDGFVAKFSAGLTANEGNTYLGTSGSDEGLGIAFNPLNGNVVVVGEARGSSLPGAFAGPQPTISSDSWDGFVSLFTSDLSNAGVSPTPFAIKPRLNVIVNTVHQEAPIQITGLTAVAPVSASGASGQVCVSTTASCGCNGGAQGTWTNSTSMTNNQYLCARTTAASAGSTFAETSINVGSYTAKFMTYTGQLFACTMDIDGDGVYRATTDGAILLRALLGMTGSAVTNGLVGHNPPRNTWAEIRDHLNNNCGMNLAQ
jgi:hypothetical protein